MDVHTKTTVDPLDLINSPKKNISDSVRIFIQEQNPLGIARCYGCSTQHSRSLEALHSKAIQIIDILLNEELLGSKFSHKWIRRVYKVGLPSKLQSKIFLSILKSPLDRRICKLISKLVELSSRIEESTCLALLKYCVANKANSILYSLFKKSFCEKGILRTYWSNSNMQYNVEEISYIIQYFHSEFDKAVASYQFKNDQKSCGHIYECREDYHSKAITFISWVTFIITIGFPLFRLNNCCDQPLKELQKRINKQIGILTEMDKLKGVLQNLSDFGTNQLIKQPSEELYHMEYVDF